MTRVKQTKELNRLSLSDEDRTRHFRKLLLRKPSTTTKDGVAVSSDTGIAHGKLRFIQGYRAFSLLLPDVMTIADEVDVQ